MASARRFFPAPLDAGLIDSTLRLLEALSAACGTVAPLAFLIRAIDSQRVVFTDITPSSFRLEQAFSIDDGESWEPNWLATFKRDTAARDMDTAHGIARGSGRRSTRPGMHAMRSGLRPCSTMRPA